MADIMHRTRAAYHCAIRVVRKNERDYVNNASPRLS